MPRYTFRNDATKTGQLADIGISPAEPLPFHGVLPKKLVGRQYKKWS